MKKMFFFFFRFLIISAQNNYDGNIIIFTGPNHVEWYAGTDPDWFPLLCGKKQSDVLTINRIRIKSVENACQSDFKT